MQFKKNVLGIFVRDRGFVVVHPMFKFFSAPPDGASTVYQISNRGFSDFLRAYYCDFLNNVYREACSLLEMDTSKVLPVLRCLKVGIAFVSSIIYVNLPNQSIVTFERIVSGRFSQLTAPLPLHRIFSSPTTTNHRLQKISKTFFLNCTS